MRVALVTNRFPTLSETFVYNHAAGLQGAGIDVTVLAISSSSDEALFADFDGAKFTGAVRHAVHGDVKPHTMLRLASRLAQASSRDLAAWRTAVTLYKTTRRALRAYLLALPCLGFDIVHFEYSGMAVQWLDALPLLEREKIVVSCRGSAERVTPIMDPARRDALRAMFERVDRVHCVSESMRDTCGGYGLVAAKAFVNRPAVDVTRFRRSTPYVARPNGPFRLLSTGRLHWMKGLETAIVAIKALVDAGHDVQYEIIGSGPDEAPLRYAVHELGLVDRVIFTGKRSSAGVKAALEACDGYLLPSVSEGISNAALEAMAMQVPVVSTSVGGMTEAITDGVDGLIVPPRSPQAISEAIVRLIVDTRFREALAMAARRRVESDFSLARQIGTFVREYQALTTRTGA